MKCHCNERSCFNTISRLGAKFSSTLCIPHTPPAPNLPSRSLATISECNLQVSTESCAVSDWELVRTLSNYLHAAVIYFTLGVLTTPRRESKLTHQLQANSGHGLGTPHSRSSPDIFLWKSFHFDTLFGIIELNRGNLSETWQTSVYFVYCLPQQNNFTVPTVDRCANKVSLIH